VLIMMNIRDLSVNLSIGSLSLCIRPTNVTSPISGSFSSEEGSVGDLGQSAEVLRKSGPENQRCCIENSDGSNPRLASSAGLTRLERISVVLLRMIPKSRL
jgi:hypothetical protein